MQIVKNFVYGKDLAESAWNGFSLELQINEYLKSHPEYSVAALSMLSGIGYKEALVVFNVREERPEKKPFVKDSSDKKVKQND